MSKISNNNFWRRALIACLIVLIFLPTATFAAKRKKSKVISAKAAILSDATRGQRLYGKNVHRKVPPASTAKVMTALLVLEHLSLNDVVTVSHRATLAAPSKINLAAGEKFKVKDLLWAILLSSANDASIALAEAVAGSETNFVRKMNQRAKGLGAKHTKFVNSSGLPTPKISQYTTAYDMYLIFRQALKHKFFHQTIQYRYKTIYSLNGRKIVLKNHNKVLFAKEWKRKVYGKTGYTRAARACFVGTINKKNNTLIIAVFGCTQRWDDIRNIIQRYGGINL